MARCPECNRFVHLELSDEPDIQSVSFDLTTKTLTLEANLVLVCSECGTEMQGASLTMSKTVNIEIPDWVDECNLSEPECQLSAVEKGGSKLKNIFGIDGEVYIEAIWREADKDYDNEWSECIEIGISDGNVNTSDFEEI